MSHHPVNAASATERCQYRTPTGRQCCIPAAGVSSSFCTRHASSEPSDSQDLILELKEKSNSFQRAEGINYALTAIYHLLAQGRISPRRAATLAYISSLLLRTLPAIDHDNEYLDAEKSDVETCPEPEQPANQSPTASSDRRTISPGKEPLPENAAGFADLVLSQKT